MKFRIVIVTIILFKFAPTVYSSGGTFGSTDATTIVYPLDCYSCREQYGAFTFCNVNNEFGACCPEHTSEAHYCATDTHHNIACTNPEHNPDLYWMTCLKTSSKQCGLEEEMTFYSILDKKEVDVLNIRESQGQACTWTITAPIDKHQYFKLDILLTFTNLTNMEVMIVSFFETEHPYTTYTSVEEGQEIRMPIYNTTYVIAKPKLGFNQTRIAFNAEVNIEIEEWIEDLDVRKIITGIITAGGLFIFIVVFGVICIIKKWKSFRKKNRAKVTVEPSKRLYHDQSDMTILKNDKREEVEHDFEDEFDKTLESPKGSYLAEKAKAKQTQS